MKDSQRRKPLAVANWKMAMTVTQGLNFVKEFLPAVGNLAESIEIVLCPPHTALYAISQGLAHSPVELGAQNLWASDTQSHTGEISAPLLTDVGCLWVMVGHWEVRRRTGETDLDCNKKMHAAFQAGLRPLLLMGEATDEHGQAEEALATRLPDLFAGCDPSQASQVAVIYEPEWTIGAKEPAPPDYVAGSCAFIRSWIGQVFGAHAAEGVRVIYGGSVTPDCADSLLASPNVDGLGAGRRGRDPIAFARIVQLIAAAKGLA